MSEEAVQAAEAPVEEIAAATTEKTEAVAAAPVVEETPAEPEDVSYQAVKRKER